MQTTSLGLSKRLPDDGTSEYVWATMGMGGGEKMICKHEWVVIGLGPYERYKCTKCGLDSRWPIKENEDEDKNT